MGINTLFDIASSGITAQRLAMEVTGENISNVNTEGYSRQRVIMENKPVGTSNGFALGTGVEIAAVQRSYDNMLQLQLVNANSTYQEGLAQQSALEQIEPSFNSLTSDGLGTAVANLFGAFQDLSVNPSGAAERQAVLTRAQIAVDSFHQADSALASVASTADANLVGITAEVTDNARNLALVNQQIMATSAVGGNPNELLDQRDLLLRKLSEQTGISYSIASDNTASVTLAGGAQLVSSTRYATLYTNATGSPATNDIMVSGLGNPPPANAPGTDTLVGTVGDGATVGGKLGGTMEVRDSIVPKYRSLLDEMANQVVTQVNTVHKAGYALDGTTNNNFFDPAGVTAGSIALDSGISAVKIAAALPTATDLAPTSSGNNVNAVKLANLGSTSFAFSTGNATLGNFYNSVVSQVGVDTEGTQNVTSQNAAFLKQLNSLRSSNSEVSLDEELLNLTKYQRAFQGASKVVNAGTDMLDTILNMVR
ncbi:flagellar hook-associated protein FlgK [Geomonas nitrogeniifigens]|uniref:flagellar hook-associated protein FlgK n=1 Tax=Geomonas diazotrophica TaxID=2843197 RepID=UPI001C2C30E2|nr:flagellar hook-associated protein FlgK [Geomonas nitrogeniifigens]QXE86218.1 flagellar hook-associated protein FlgK [Geomonas nitrogeniifigens]